MCGPARVAGAKDCRIEDASEAVAALRLSGTGVGPLIGSPSGTPVVKAERAQMRAPRMCRTHPDVPELVRVALSVALDRCFERQNLAELGQAGRILERQCTGVAVDCRDPAADRSSPTPHGLSRDQALERRGSIEIPT